MPETASPSLRILATELGVGRNTVQTALDRLMAAGVVCTRPGSGTFIGIDLPGGRPAERNRAPGSTTPPLSQRGRRLATARTTPVSGAGAFALGHPVTKGFPRERWRQALSRTTQVFGRTPADAAGFAPLRDALARHVALTRGVRCHADQIIVCSSSLQALDLALTVLVDPGDAVWIEDPCYWGAAVAIERAGATRVAVPVDADGLVVERGVERGPTARAVFVTPAAQFPTGVRLASGRRAALETWARTRRAWLIEDDYGAEFLDPATAPAPLSAMAPECTCLIGTLSQVLLPELRLAYLVVPPQVSPAFGTAREHQDRFAALVPQMALHDLLADGVVAAHLRRVAGIAARRRAHLIGAVHTYLSDYLTLDEGTGGTWLYARGRAGVEESSVVGAGRRAGLIVTGASGNSMSPDDTPSAVLLGYVHLSETDLTAACRALAAALRRK